MKELPEEVISFRRYLKRRQCAPHTVRSYLHDWDLFLRQVNKPVLEVTPQDVEAFIEAQQAQGRTATTINRRLTSLRRLYTYLRQSDYPDLEPPVQPALHRLRTPHPLPRCLREEEVQRFFAVLDEDRDRALFLLMLRAGLRVQEIVALQMEDLDLPHQQMEIQASKNGRERLVYLSPDAQAALQTYLDQRPPSPCSEVFLVPKGRGQGHGISVRGIQKRLEYYAAQTGLSLTCHSLRHTFASQLLNHGADMATVQLLLGHAHVTTTQRYARVSNPKAREDYFRGMARVLARQAPAPPPLPSPKDVEKEEGGRPETTGRGGRGLGGPSPDRPGPAEAPFRPGGTESLLTEPAPVVQAGPPGPREPGPSSPAFDPGPR